MHGAEDDSRIAPLRREWDADKTSRVFVRLADEYRRSDRLAEAREVLEEGLAARPGYLPAVVSLARVELESGDADRARGRLVEVLERDPTNLVASRMMIEAHLALGRPDDARESLDRYRMLHDDEEDIEALGNRIEERAGQIGSDAAAERVAESASGEAGGGPDVRPGAGVASSGPATTESAGRGRAVFALPAPPAPRLPTGDGSRRRSERSLVGGRDLPLALSAPPAPKGELFSVAAAPAPPVVEEAPAESAPGEVALETPIEGTLPGESLEEAPPEAPPTEALEEPETASVEGPEPILEDTEPMISPASPAPRKAEIEAEETATLGELYLRQGHVEEAERIFRKVLLLDPESSTALRGLGEVERRTSREGALSAEEILGAQADEVPGLTGRKIALLEGYRTILRRGARRVSGTAEQGQ